MGTERAGQGKTEAKAVLPPWGSVSPAPRTVKLRFKHCIVMFHGLGVGAGREGETSWKLLWTKALKLNPLPFQLRERLSYGSKASTEVYAENIT